MAAMYAALEAIADGKAGEVELEWTTEGDDHTERLVITVRRDVRQFVMHTE